MDVLSTLTEFSTALAGFSGIVIAISASDGPVAPLTWFRNLCALAWSLAVAFASVFPAIFETSGASPTRVWVGSGLIVAFTSAALLAFALRAAQRLSPAERARLLGPFRVVCLGGNAAVDATRPDRPRVAPWYPAPCQGVARSFGKEPCVAERGSGGRHGIPTTGSLNHIDISVGYPERSIPFYDALFSSLGYTRWALSAADWSGERPSRATWSIELCDGSVFAVEVRPAQARSRDHRYDRYAPGPHHLAFNAASPEVVRGVHAAMVEAGATVLDPPADYGDEDGYAPGYYAVFFADPDGLKLEVAHVPRTNP